MAENNYSTWRRIIFTLISTSLMVDCVSPNTNFTEDLNVIVLQDDECQTMMKYPKLAIPHKGASCFSNKTDSGEMILSCQKGVEIKWLKHVNDDVYFLKLIEWPTKCFPLTQMIQQFPHVRNLSIYNSSLTKFHYDTTSTTKYLKNLKLNYLYNWTIEDDFLRLFPALEELDLRSNLFISIDPDMLSQPKGLNNVYLSNNRWNCTHEGIQWMHELNTTSALLAISRITDFKNLTCQGNMYPGKPLHIVMDILKTLREECPPRCSCHLTNLVRNPEGVLFPVSTADCRHLGLTELPPKIPNITTILMLHGNKITDVRPLSQNLAYRRVADVYLDDNMVSSVQPLEGADWMQTFRVFSLRGNNMTKLPAFAFDNAFQHNQNIAHVYLGRNPWRCDCHFTPRFQDLLSKYQELMADLEDITCVTTDIPEILNVQVITISRSTICLQVEETLQPIDILNVVLASLIVLILGKLAYDYYCFKKTGKLPWIVSKMP